MYIFLLACLPLVAIIACVANGKFYGKSFIPALAFGFVIGGILCCCRKFVFFNDYVWTEDFMPAGMHIWLHDVIIPLIISCVVYFLFDRDTITYKAAAVGPLMLGVYMALIPFTSIKGDDRITVFMIFGRPMLYAGMCLIMSRFAYFSAAFLRAKNVVLAVIFAIPAFAVLFVPAFVEALWYYTNDISYTLISALFAGGAILFYIFTGLKKGPEYDSEPVENNKISE